MWLSINTSTSHMLCSIHRTPLKYPYSRPPRITTNVRRAWLTDINTERLHILSFCILSNLAHVTSTSAHLRPYIVDIKDFNEQLLWCIYNFLLMIFTRVCKKNVRNWIVPRHIHYKFSLPVPLLIYWWTIFSLRFTIFRKTPNYIKSSQQLDFTSSILPTNSTISF